MAESESKREKGQPAASGPSPASPAGDQRDAASAYAGAQASFRQRMEQCKAKLAERYAHEYASYGNAIAAAQKDFDDACAHAWQRYLQELNEAWTAGDTEAQAAKAQERFATLFEELSAIGSAPQAVADAYVAFARRLAQAQAPGGAGRPVADEHQAYLHALQQATSASEAYRRAAEAHAEWLLLARRLHDERWTRAYNAYGAYFKAVNDALAATRFPARADAAIEGSLAGLQAAWQEAQEEYRTASVALLKSLQAAAESSNRPLSS